MSKSSRTQIINHLLAFREKVATVGSPNFTLAEIDRAIEIAKGLAS